MDNIQLTLIILIIPFVVEYNLMYLLDVRKTKTKSCF